MSELNQQTLDELHKVRALVNDPQHWIKGMYYVHRSDGDMAYCVSGALNTALSELRSRGHLRALFLEHVTGGRSIPGWNDDPSVTHDDIMAGFDKVEEVLTG